MCGLTSASSTLRNVWSLLAPIQVAFLPCCGPMSGTTPALQCDTHPDALDSSSTGLHSCPFCNGKNEMIMVINSRFKCYHIYDPLLESYKNVPSVDDHKKQTNKQTKQTEKNKKLETLHISKLVHYSRTTLFFE